MVTHRHSGAPDRKPTRRRRSTFKAANLTRVVHSRLIVCVCLDCPARFESTPAALHHAGRHRHIVDVTYRAVFSYVPNECLDLDE